MRKALRTIICAASAAVICAAPIAPTFAGISASTAITAEAAFYSDNGSYITLDADQIKTNSGFFTETPVTSFGTRKTFSMSNLQTFQIQHVEFDVVSTTPSTIANDLKKAKIKVVSSIDKTNTSTSFTNTNYYFLDYRCTDTKTKKYHCTCEFVVYGKSYTATIDLGSKFTTSNLKAKGKAENNYYWVEAIPPSGEKVYAIFPKTGKFKESDPNATVTINKSSVEKWAKDLCLLANSLKGLTGFSRDTVFSFPVEYMPKKFITNPEGGYTVGSLPSHMCTKNGNWVKNGNDYSKYSLIWLAPYAVTTTGQLIYNNIQLHAETQVMNKDMTHEFGHVYKQIEKGGKILDNWALKYKYGKSDEFFATVRALTAMSNCKPLNSYKIKLSALENAKIDCVFDDDLSSIESRFSCILVNKIGFERLENFYNASNANMWDGGTNLAFANKLTKELGFDKAPYNVPKEIKKVEDINAYEGYLKVVNSLVGLYGYKNASKVDEFYVNLCMDCRVTDYTGKALVKKFIVEVLGEDLGKKKTS